MTQKDFPIHSCTECPFSKKSNLYILSGKVNCKILLKTRSDNKPMANITNSYLLRTIPTNCPL